MNKFLLACIVSTLTACGGGGGGGGGGSSDNTANSSSPPANTDSSWSIPENEIEDPGPGRNGIPSLNYPLFVPAEAVEMHPNELILGVHHRGDLKAYPHRILNWHEVVNDRFADEVHVLSYCPLTGSAVFWESGSSAERPAWGVSGLLYNSNLILFDHETESHWVQMLEEAVQGPRKGEIPISHKLVEMTWGAWQALYPGSQVVDDDTGFDRDYSKYPYISHRTDENLLFPVSNEDNRLHPKERVVGIRNRQGQSKVFQISGFTESLEVLNTEFLGTPIVVIGSSKMRFAAIYLRQTNDGIAQVLSPIEGQHPAVMRDDEGNHWDVFGRALSGPRQGQELGKTDSYTTYWFGWAAFFPNADIHF